MRCGRSRTRDVGAIAPEELGLRTGLVARHLAVVVAQDTHALLDRRVGALFLHGEQPADAAHVGAVKASVLQVSVRLARSLRACGHHFVWKSKMASSFGFFGIWPARAPE